MSSKTEQSFFKVLTTSDFNKFLKLPHVFIQKHGSIFPQKVKLRVKSGKSWNVKVEAIEDKDGDGEVFCFKSGWKEFARDVGLKLGEFLEFVSDDDGFTFHVSVYDKSSACERKIPEVEDDVFICSGSSREILKPLYCEVLLKFHQRSRVTLKKRFSKAAGLAEKESVTLVGEYSKELVDLDHRGGSRVDLTKGWREFRIANALEYEQKYSFEFKPTKNAIYVKKVNLGN